jgi:hypothetical protein
MNCLIFCPNCREPLCESTGNIRTCKNGHKFEVFIVAGFLTIKGNYDFSKQKVTIVDDI